MNTRYGLTIESKKQGISVTVLGVTYSGDALQFLKDNVKNAIFQDYTTGVIHSDWQFKTYCRKCGKPSQGYAFCSKDCRLNHYSDNFKKEYSIK